MRKDFHIAAAAAALMFFSVPAGVAVAQTGTATAPATTTDPATTTAPAATTTTPATTPEPAAAATATEKPDGAKKTKKPAKKLTRQQEIDRSIDNGTVPARYRRSVPKEYQQYIPFDKR